jgi:hypothetical protein
MKGFVNPLQMGLLGGIAAWGRQLDKFNMLNASLEASKERYKSRYDAMAQVQNERTKNNMLLKQMQMEGNQRTFTAPRNNPDGTIDTVTYRNVYNPATQSYEPHEVGHVPYVPKGSTASPYKTVGGSLVDTRKLDANGNPTAVYTAPDKQGAIQDRQLTVQAAREKAIADRQKDAQQRADQAKKIDRVETLTGKDMANWDKTTDDATKRQFLKDAGVPLPENTPEHLGGMIGGNPPSGDALENLRGAYEKAMQDKHAKNLGVTSKQLEEGAPAGAVPADTGDTGSAQPQFTPDGRQIKYDASGNPFIKGPDGKPTPYVADANGNPDSPLAMDTVDMSDEGAQSPDDEESAPTSGGGLIAGAGAGPDDEEEEQGLMSGQYS